MSFVCEELADTSEVADGVAKYREVVTSVAKGEPEPEAVEMMALLWEARKTREDFQADVERRRRRFQAAADLEEATRIQAQRPAAQARVAELRRELSEIERSIKPQLLAKLREIEEAERHERTLSRSGGVAEASRVLMADYPPEIDREIRFRQARIKALGEEAASPYGEIIERAKYAGDETKYRITILRDRERTLEKKLDRTKDAKGDTAKAERAERRRELATVQADIAREEAEIQRRRVAVPAEIARLRQEIVNLEHQRANAELFRW